MTTKLYPINRLSFMWAVAFYVIRDRYHRYEQNLAHLNTLGAGSFSWDDEEALSRELTALANDKRADTNVRAVARAVLLDVGARADYDACLIEDEGRIREPDFGLLSKLPGSGELHTEAAIRMLFKQSRASHHAAVRANDSAMLLVGPKSDSMGYSLNPALDASGIGSLADIMQEANDFSMVVRLPEEFYIKDAPVIGTARVAATFCDIIQVVSGTDVRLEAAWSSDMASFRPPPSKQLNLEYKKQFYSASGYRDGNTLFINAKKADGSTHAIDLAMEGLKTERLPYHCPSMRLSEQFDKVFKADRSLDDKQYQRDISELRQLANRAAVIKAAMGSRAASGVSAEAGDVSAEQILLVGFPVAQSVRALHQDDGLSNLSVEDIKNSRKLHIADANSVGVARLGTTPKYGLLYSNGGVVPFRIVWLGVRGSYRVTPTEVDVARYLPSQLQTSLAAQQELLALRAARASGLPSVTISVDTESPLALRKWYGDDPDVRRIATQRLAAVSELMGKVGWTVSFAEKSINFRHIQPTLLSLSLDTRQRVDVRNRADRLNTEVEAASFSGVDEEGSHATKVKARQFKLMTEGNKPRRNVIPLLPTKKFGVTPIREMVFTLWGPSEQSKQYACLKQLKVRQNEIQKAIRSVQESSGVFSLLGWNPETQEEGEYPLITGLSLKLHKTDVELIRSGIKTLLTRSTQIGKMAINQVGELTPGKEGAPIYVKYLGELTYDEAMAMLDRRSAGGGTGLAEYVQREAIFEDEPEPAELYSATLRAVKPDVRVWMRGAASDDRGDHVPKMHLYATSDDQDELAHDTSPEKNKFSPVRALRLWAAIQLGLLQTAQNYADDAASGNPSLEPPKAPFVLVASYLCDREQMRQLAPHVMPIALSDNSPYMAAISLFDIPTIKATSSIPSAGDLLTVEVPHANEYDEGIVPVTMAKTDIFESLEGLACVRPTHKGHLEPIGNTRFNVFAYKYVSQLPSFELTDDPAKNEAHYWATLSENVKARPMRMGSGGAQVMGERESLMAHGGYQASKSAPEVREYKTKVRYVQLTIVNLFQDIMRATGLMISSHRAVRDADTQIIKHETKGRILNLNKVLDSGQITELLVATSEDKPYEVDVAVSLPAGTYAGALIEVPFKLTVTKTETGSHIVITKLDPSTRMTPGALLALQLARHGIEAPDPDDTKDVLRALTELRSSLQSEYSHKIDRGVIATRQEERLLREAYAGDEEQTELLLSRMEPSEDSVLDRLAKLNPSSRRPRRERRPRGRRNPLRDPAEQEALAAVAAGRATDEQKALATAAVERIKTEKSAGSWDVTPAVMQGYFPRSGRIDSFTLKERIPAATSHFDLISRSEDVEPAAIDLTLGEADLPFESNDGLRRVAEYAELTAPEYARILSQLKTRRSSDTTMQPSTATYRSAPVGGPVRKKRLSTYSPPAAVLNIVGNNELIWLSPVSSDVQRIIVYRRGVHLDTDMFTRDRTQTPALVGRALQASVYWLAQKAARARSVKVFFGRVGDDRLYLVYIPGQVLTQEGLTAALQQAASGTPGRVERWTDNAADLKRDRENYEKAEHTATGGKYVAPTMREVTPQKVPSHQEPQRVMPQVQPPVRDEDEEVVEIVADDE